MRAKALRIVFWAGAMLWADGRYAKSLTDRVFHWVHGAEVTTHQLADVAITLLGDPSAVWILAKDASAPLFAVAEDFAEFGLGLVAVIVLEQEHDRSEGIGFEINKVIRREGGKIGGSTFEISIGVFGVSCGVLVARIDPFTVFVFVAGEPGYGVGNLLTTGVKGR